jgi:2-oxoglutarate ferredoxin oxidoreductase subunit alpha
MEDELAASITLQGAVWAGARAFTVTSGPGFSLMMEHIGYAAMTETPCVFVDVQRGGPSTGLPTLPAQGDMMQARFGSHGDYGMIALCPDSPQECFDLTIQAFNLAERFRNPVMLMLDECVGHMTEKVVIPPAGEIDVAPRRIATKPPGEFKLFEPCADGVPEMVHAGQGYNIHVTGLTHNELGYGDLTVAQQDKLVRRLLDKITRARDEICEYETDNIEDADVVVVSYGITSRIARRAVQIAREGGLKAGTFRMVTIWPFPENQIRELAGRVKALIVPELNLGQMVIEVERCAGGQCKVIPVSHAGGSVHKPEAIVEAIERGLRS